MDRDLETLARVAVDCGIKLHEALGPGLLESVYEACLYQSLVERGLTVRRQLPVPVRFNGLVLQEGFRADLLVEDQLLLELKSTEAHAPVHAKQVLTYLRLLELKLGLLMNFGAVRFKDGVRRIANDYYRDRALP
jgi:GxxExxY protein